MMIIIIGNVIMVLTCFLRWRWFSSEQKSRIFLWDQASRRPGRAGLGQPAELSSTTGKNVNTDTEPGTCCSQPSVSLSSQGWDENVEISW